MTGTGNAILILSMALLAMAVAPPSATADPYIALGDSITAGSGASPGKGYVDLLYGDYQADLGADQLLNLSQGGATSTSLVSGGQLTTAVADIDAASDTKAVTIGIGGYDYLSGKCQTNWDDAATCPYRANLVNALTALKTALDNDPGSEPLTVMGYYNPATGTFNESAIELGLLGSNRKLDCSDTASKVGLNDVILQEAIRLGVGFANPFKAFDNGGQSLIADGIHPNNAGHEALADAFRKATIPAECGADDTTPPNTRITKGAPKKTDKSSLTFKFSSSEAKSSFECKLDGKPWKPCSSPKKLKNLDRGKHEFKVRAIDKAGNVDPSPAKDDFKVVR